MKAPRTTTISLAVASVAALILSLWMIMIWETPEAQKVTLEITGVSGLKIETRINADGVEQNLSGTIPAQYTVEGHRISWEVRCLDSPESEMFRVAVHTPAGRNFGGFAEDDSILRGGLVGPSGLYRSRTWHGRFEE